MGTKRKRILHVKEITEPSVEYVSLVDRGANGTPFKFVKSNEKGKSKPMNILQKILGLTPDSPKVPFVAVVLEKNYKGVNEAAESNGLDVLTENGKTVLVQKGVDLQEMALSAIEVSEGVTALVPTEDMPPVEIAKGIGDIIEDSVSFNETKDAFMLMPTIHASFDALGNALHNTMRKAETTEEYIATASKAVDDFAKFVKGALASNGEVLFKVDDILAGLEIEDETETPEEGDGTVIEKSEDDDTSDDTEGEDAADDQGADDSMDDSADDGESADDDSTAEISESADGVLDKIGSMFSAVEQQISDLATDMNDKITGLTGELATVTKASNDAVTVAQKAQEAVQGSLSASPDNAIDDDDGDGGETVRKANHKEERWKGLLPFGD